MDFAHLSRPALCNGYRFSFPKEKRPGRGVDYPPLFSAEVKERLELYPSPFKGFIALNVSSHSVM